MRILLEVSDNKADMFLEFIRNLPFVKKSEKIPANQITNPAILQSIEEYEQGKTTPTPLSLSELKAMISA
jgi:hypothetical protein